MYVLYMTFIFENVSESDKKVHGYFAEIKIKRTFATHLEKQMPAMIR